MLKVFKSFLNDKDGFSAKDYLMVIFSGLYVILMLTTFGMALTGFEISQFLKLLQSLDGIVMTIIGGVFGLNAIQRVFDKGGSKVTVNGKQEEPTQIEE